MSEEVKKRATSKKANAVDYEKLLKQLHDKIYAQLNPKPTKDVDEVIAKMSSVVPFR